MSNNLKDEILELLWSLREKGSKSYMDIIEGISDSDNDTSDIMRKMEKAGLIRIIGDDVELTEKGEARSRDLTRRHRLAERLFYDVLEVGMEESEFAACEIEHFLSPHVTDSVCSFLGHPPTCPHGKPIPRGKCCSRYKADIKPLVMQLKELEVGSEARIVFIVPSDDTRLERLASMGIIPGSIIRLRQKRPSYVLEIDETSLALDSLIAEEIYVKEQV
ncbi:MAG TPA: DtxR family transcriptional regulator [Nitrospirae bacterium]|nr:iron-dependent repressor IdeR [bacterium BMS3Abin09]GBE40429.1 iron-dependent repressor IdeR [bacterium BMS3Bbin09]HDH34506.1 DtxR family transcriptional regulator [Nitrospirota bacterium]HDO67035.1 DtxR family transcriptional regulator [Nitrospirota bacterium]HDZ84231.1 DtxR family transcriptional regulator [Nitrospirota bacterium]